MNKGNGGNNNVMPFRGAANGSKAGNNSNMPQAAPAPIVLKNLPLTEYMPDGRLMFNRSQNDIWTLTAAQQEYKNAFNQFDAHILNGPPGSGKTDLTAHSILQMLKGGKVQRVIISTPVDEGGETLGFSKGTDHEKMLTHCSQVLEAMDGHLGRGNFIEGKKIREALIAQGTIELVPLGKLSGLNARGTILYIDEAHKAKMQHLLMAMSRVHTRGSKVIFSGDERQHLSGGVSDYRKFTARFSDPAYGNLVKVTKYSPDDVKRHPLAKLMTERGDDIPPGLAARMRAEAYDEERTISILRDHFKRSAQGGHKDPMAEQAARLYMQKLDPVALLQIIEGSNDQNGPA